MGEEPLQRNTSSTAIWSTVIGVTLVLYFLSPGFFIAAYRRWGWEPPPMLNTPLTVVYSPLALLAKWEPVGNFYNWYLTLCAGQHMSSAP